MLLVFAFLLTKNVFSNITPVVMWHGMGVTSYDLNFVATLIQKEIPGIHIINLQIGNNPEEDVLNSYLKDVNDQVEYVCSLLRNDDKLSNGYNAIGFSQGAQFLRAVAQRCPNPPMINLISIGGQHQGVYGFPRCLPDHHKLCEYLRRILSLGAYSKYVQDNLVQAQYWHDPLNEENYKENSIFLADINQERAFNLSYKKNLLKLKNFVMVLFANDSMVDPPISEWFGFYVPGQNVDFLSLQDSSLYKKDLLGLKTLEKQGKLIFLKVDSDHLHFTEEWFIENIINRFLRSESPKYLSLLHCYKNLTLCKPSKDSDVNGRSHEDILFQNNFLKEKVRELSFELYNAKSFIKVLEKEVLGRIQQIQLLGENIKGDFHEESWKSIESQIRSNRCKAYQKSFSLLNSTEQSLGRKASGSRLHTVREVNLFKEEGESLGISVIGGSEFGVPLIITNMERKEDCASHNKNTDQLSVGDVLLSVNEVSLKNFTHNEAISLLSQQKGHFVLRVESYLQDSDLDEGTEDSQSS